uniref:(California timema) hypothetical protein n=1 Tax=Timema californicum TaxID=61474 RepID=A0A7R9JBC8_TIMCA|nr:unnamed protein product [Timema californicum]
MASFLLKNVKMIDIRSLLKLNRRVLFGDDLVFKNLGVTLSYPKNHFRFLESWLIITVEDTACSKRWKSNKNPDTIIDVKRKIVIHNIDAAEQKKTMFFNKSIVTCLLPFDFFPGSASRNNLCVSQVGQQLIQVERALKCIRIFVEKVENYLEKNSFGRLNQSNLDIQFIGSAAYFKSDALDHMATEVGNNIVCLGYITRGLVL